MPSPDPIPTTLSDHLRQLGLVHTATDLNDLVARATQKRWSPVVLLEHLAKAELDARLQYRVERRLRDARLGRFKPIADWEWDWPKQIHRPTVDRVLALDFLEKKENVILVAAHGLGKTMLAKNLVHQVILAGHPTRHGIRARAELRAASVGLAGLAATDFTQEFVRRPKWLFGR